MSQIMVLEVVNVLNRVIFIVCTNNNFNCILNQYLKLKISQHYALLIKKKTATKCLKIVTFMAQNRVTFNIECVNTTFSVDNNPK